MISELHNLKQDNEERIKQAKKMIKQNEKIWKAEKELSPLHKFGPIVTVGGTGTAKRVSSGALAQYNKSQREYERRRQSYQAQVDEGLEQRSSIARRIVREMEPPQLEEPTPSVDLASHTPSDIFGIRSPAARSPRGSPRGTKRRRSLERRPPGRESRRASVEPEMEESVSSSPSPTRHGTPKLEDYLNGRSSRGRVEFVDDLTETPRDDLPFHIQDWQREQQTESESSNSIPISKREANEQEFARHMERNQRMLIDLVANTDPVPEIPTGALGSLDVDGYLDRIRGHLRGAVPLRAQSVGAPDVPQGRRRAASVGAPAVGPPLPARANFLELQKRALKVARARAPRQRMVAELPGAHQPTFSNRNVLSQSFGSRMGAERHIQLGNGNIRATRGSATITLRKKNPQDIAQISAFLRVNFQFGAKVGGTRYALVGLVPAVISKLPGTVSVST